VRSRAGQGKIDRLSSVENGGRRTAEEVRILPELTRTPVLLGHFFILHHGDGTFMEDHFGLLWIHFGFAAIVGAIMLLFVA
jgi:hypothetical protein